MPRLIVYNIPAPARYGIVRETVTELTHAQEHVLEAQEIVVRSLCDPPLPGALSAQGSTSGVSRKES